jgi:plastocyanin
MDLTVIQKDHKIEISDSGFNPSIINVNPEDRIWFVWTDTKKSHNIRQVTHQDQFIKNGFLSGALMEPPGAYMHTFTEQGIFYYHSDGLKNCIGAVVVVPEPTVTIII